MPFDPSGLFDCLSLGEPSAIVTFDYTIEDDQGFSDSATATIEVTPANDAPIAAPLLRLWTKMRHQFH